MIQTFLKPRFINPVIIMLFFNSIHIYGQQKDQYVLKDTVILTQNQINYLVNVAIDNIFHIKISSSYQNLKVLSISDYLWFISKDSLLFTFDYQSDDELLKEYEEVKIVSPTHRQDLSKLIPNIHVNYLIEVKYDSTEDTIKPSSNSQNHMVHMRLSDLYIKDNQISFFIKTRCKLLHLDDYWESTFRIYASICPYGEIYPMRFDNLETINHLWYARFIDIYDFGISPCLDYPRERANQK
jgi:hypothetical protein